jgi:ectoine hydroxylase-related dioxygenase (phytanoyl-CoA dioxygenase family)
MPKGAPFDQSQIRATPETAKETLEKYGVAVVPSVLSAEKCGVLYSMMCDFFEQITVNAAVPFVRDKEETYGTLLDMMPHHGMLFQWYGIGHAAFQWWLRQQPEVYSVFATLWGTPAEDMLVSFDGASFQMPPDGKRRGAGNGKHWFHRDQSLMRHGFECAQGWITALDVQSCDATLCVLAGSHLYSSELAQEYKGLVGPRDWVRIEDETVDFLKKRGCEEVRVECPPGSLVLWDSRTIHYGASPLKTRTTPRARAVCYVCFVPRSMASPDNLKKKRNAFDNRRTTSHWPNRATLFSPTPHTYGKKLPALCAPPPPQMTQIGMRFAGLD